MKDDKKIENLFFFKCFVFYKVSKPIITRETDKTKIENFIFNTREAGTRATFKYCFRKLK